MLTADQIKNALANKNDFYGEAFSRLELQSAIVRTMNRDCGEAERRERLEMFLLEEVVCFSFWNKKTMKDEILTAEQLAGHLINVWYELQ